MIFISLILLIIFIIFLQKKGLLFENYVDFNNNQIFIQNDFIIKLSKFLNNGKDLGLYVNKSYEKGATIEISPLIEISKPCDSLIDYFFGYNKKKYMAIGYIPLINHSKNYNCLWEIKDSRTIRLYATKDINREEELLTSYGEKYFLSRNIKEN